MKRIDRITRSQWLGCVKVSVLSVAGMMSVITSTYADTLLAQKSTPVAVRFGVRALSPDTAVDRQVAFVTQSVSLPDVVCNACGTGHYYWRSEWLPTGVNYLVEDSQQERGWYLFASGVKGIGIGIETKNHGVASSVQQGEGQRAKIAMNGTVGLVKMAQDTGAGLASLPAAQFRRLTRFYDAQHQEVYAQEDTVRVEADLRVPTCTSSSGSLNFMLPDVPQTWLKHHVAVGDYADSLASPTQWIVAQCSPNTSRLSIRFLPDGAVADSTLGRSTILVGYDTQTGEESGTGFLMKYHATGFGGVRDGAVSWDSTLPLVVDNPHPRGDSSALTQGISVSLQAFYARPDNQRSVEAGQLSAKGIYQIAYD